MDEEDLYGIPGDYYFSQENYTENTSIFNEFMGNALVENLNPFDGFGGCMRATIVVGFVSE
jgi:hypothetical protein